MAEKRSAGRPKRGYAVITDESVAKATVASLLKQGAAGLSISRIATEIGVRSQSLYHHISSITDAVNAARSLLLKDIENVISDGSDWEQSVLDVAEEYYNRFLPLGEANGIFFVHEISDPTTLQLYETFLSSAIKEGIEPGAAMTLLLDIEYTIFAIIFEQTSLQSLFQTSSVSSGQFPILEELLTKHSTAPAASRTRLRERVQSLLRDAKLRDAKLLD